MSLSQRIEKEYVDAYKNRDSQRLGVLRLLKTAAKNRLVELKRPQGELSDEEMLEVIGRQAKQRQDSIEQYNAANRPDLAEKEAGELSILKEYLPSPLTREELDAAITEAIKRSGAATPSDMGKVMGIIMAECKGQVDGKAVSQEIRKRLSAQ